MSILFYNYYDELVEQDKTEIFDYIDVLVDGRYEEDLKNKTDKNGNEYQEYSTYVLEAKLVIRDMVFSIGSEFVENEKENVDKQDCEIKAFKRLAKKIKKEYPRLRIIISGDALYASKPVIDICKEKGWKYIIRFRIRYNRYKKIFTR